MISIDEIVKKGIFAMLDILSQLVITNIRSVSTMYTPKQNNKITRNNRLCWGLIIKYEGETIYKNHVGKFISNENHLVILPKGASYEWTCTKAGRYIIIDFDSDLEYDNLFSLNIGNDGEILKMFKELETLHFSKKNFYQIACISQVYSVILKALDVHRNSAKYIPNHKRLRLAPAIDYIANNFTQSIKNEELASLCNMSTVYFRKLFCEVYEVSPINYIHKLRIKKAKEMLQSDYSNVTDIALFLGYNNIYEFSKAFKKHTGVSPTRY